MQVSDVEFKKYQLIFEFEAANRPLSLAEKKILMGGSIGFLRLGLRGLEREEWERRSYESGSLS